MNNSEDISLGRFDSCLGHQTHTNMQGDAMSRIITVTFLAIAALALVVLIEAHNGKSEIESSIKLIVMDRDVPNSPVDSNVILVNRGKSSVDIVYHAFEFELEPGEKLELGDLPEGSVVEISTRVLFFDLPAAKFIVP